MDDRDSPDFDWPNGGSPAPTTGTQNGHSHEPACDQCRVRKVRCNREHPKCSNCKKAKVPCGFSNKGKRVNHTTKLVNNVDVLGKRMDKIEGAILRWVNATEQHINVTTTLLQSSKANSSNEESDDFATRRSHSMEIDSENSPIDNAEDRNFPPEQESRHLITERGGYERFFGSGSMYSIWAEIISATEELLSPSQSSAKSRGSPDPHNSQSPQTSSNGAIIAALDPVLRSTLQTAAEDLQRNIAEPALEDCSDNTPLSLPPRFLLETILDSFLKELNPVLPMFARSSLLEAIKLQYDPQQDHFDPAWATCFNNIVLQILTTKAGAGADSPSRSAMDDSLKTTFLVNAQRCYRNMERFLQPRVVNVQALLSMALVALKYFRHTIFETLFSLACQVAKAVGLHQQVNTTSDRDTSEAERINLFWTLFTIDKQLALMCGQSCHLHGFDCDVPLPSAAATNDMPLCDNWIAAIKLAFINESIYRNLYSAVSSRASDAQQQRKVESLNQKLNSWATRHQQLLNEKSNWTPQRSSSALELRYAMLTSQILVLRRSKHKESRVQLLTHARTSLNIIKDLCEASITIASNVALERIILHYPLVAFVELYKSVIEDVSNTPPEDIQLLTLITERINNQAETPSRSSYLAKVKIATRLCSNVCLSIKGAKEFSTATGPIMSSFALPDQSPSELGCWSRSSDSLFPMSSDPAPNLSMPGDDFMWNVSYPNLSDSIQTVPELMPTSGVSDFSNNFQFSYAANVPPVTSHLSNENLENMCRTTPLYPFQ